MQMLFKAVLSEAWRNIISGTSKTLALGLILFASVGLSAIFNCVMYGNQVDAVAHWRASGASTYLINLPGRVDGAKCDSLSQIPGINHSGATRESQTLTLSQLPSNPLTTLEGTPGLISLLATNSHHSISPAGAWISSDLAKDLAANGRPTDLHLVPDNTARETAPVVPVAGIYQYEEDGRLPVLAYNLVFPVLASQWFDTCWVEIWPESRNLQTLLSYPLAPVSNQDEPQVQQLNGSLGHSFHSANRQAIPAWVFLIFSTVFGLFLGLGSARVRKLEIASQLHAGVDKITTVVQHAIEQCGAMLVCASLTMATLSLLTTAKYHFERGVFVLGLVTLATGLGSYLLGNLVGVSAIRESRLFLYFKTR